MYNAEKTIADTLDSVKKQRTKHPFEIILVNDGSSDKGITKAENFKEENPQIPVIILQQENKGVSAARNKGIKIAKGEFIALLDADDVWHPDKTEKQMCFLQNPEYKIDLLATARNNSKILFPYRMDYRKLAKVTFNKLLVRNEIQPSTVIFKRQILRNTGFFDDSQRYAEDVNFFLKASLKNNLYILGESLVTAGGGKRSFGVSGLSANLEEMKKGFQKNVFEMYQNRKLNYLKYRFFYFFYELKYWILVLRRNLSKN